jgi:hypothetical protein
LFFEQVPEAGFEVPDEEELLTGGAAAYNFGLVTGRTTVGVDAPLRYVFVDEMLGTGPVG